jgi:peptide/nickel transport system substrate-binding protein/oligopeptide transport system substrate-binding protein
LIAIAVVALAVAIPVAVKRASAPARSAGDGHPPPTKGGDARPAPPAGTPSVFRFYQESPSNLDPPLAADSYSSCVIAQIYSPLVGLTSDLEPTPQVAESWTISRDGRRYVFQIRPGVKFHHGREVTARDFEYSITRVFREPHRSEGFAAGYLDAIDGAPAYMNGKAASVRGIRVLGRYKLEITLSRPYSSLLTALALDQTSAVPRELIEKGGADALEQRPVGSGPFRFVRREGRHAVVLSANPDYFMGQPGIDTVVFYSPHGDVTSLGADALLEGRATLSQLPSDRIEEFRARPGIAVLRWNDLSLAFVGMNAARPPLHDARVRQAIALAMDRQAMISRRPEGKSIATGVLPPGLPGYTPTQKAYARDVAAARALLAQAGYGPGHPLPTITMVKSVSNSDLRGVDSVMVRSLAEAGIRVQIRYEPWAVLDSLITYRKASMFGLAWVADIPDPDTFLRALFYSGSSTNYFRFQDSTVDSLLDLAQSSGDPSLRMSAYRKAEEAILRAAPFVPLYHTASFIGLRDDVSGLEMNPLGISTLAMEKLRFTEPRNDAAGLQAAR